MPTGSKNFGAKAGVSLASSLLALTGALLAHRAAAQGDAPAATEEVIVTGMRSSLENAQDIKRDADTFVDAISSTDIGALPDRSVLEAMQRIPGISIERFAAATDPDHIGVEGSGAVVRGMTQTRSEFNGRDSFTANSGRGLSFQDVPPELMAGVDVYKNQTADMIEGGIAGTISLRTRKPFDNPGFQASFSADGTYGDMVEKITPTVSGLISNTWETDLGEFGVLVNASYSNLEASSHGIQTDRFDFRPLVGAAHPLLRFDYVDSPYEYDNSFQHVLEGTQEGDLGVLVPNGANMMMKTDERTRKGIATALQWESPDDSLQATFQFMRSDARLSWTEYSLKYQTQYNTQRTLPPIRITDSGREFHQEFLFDDNGVFQAGTLTDAPNGWRSSTESRIPNDYGGDNSVPSFGHRFHADNRFKDTRTVIDDFALNLEWRATDTLTITADFQRINAETEDDDYQLMLMTHAVQDYDLTGSTPRLGMRNPWTHAPEQAIDYYQAQGTNFTDQAYAEGANGEDVTSYFTDPRNYNYNAALDHFERSEGTSTAARLDAELELDAGPFTRLKTGVRTATREQTVRFSAYNWGALGSIWQTPVAWLDSEVVAEAGMDDYQIIDWGDFYRGDILEMDRGFGIIHPTDQLTRDYDSWGERFAALTLDSCEDFRPASDRIDREEPVVDGECRAAPLEKVDTHFLPREVNTVKESNQAAYVRLDFAFDDWAVPVVGNVGVRYVKVEHEVTGNVIFPDLRPSFRAPEGFNPSTVLDLYAGLRENNGIFNGINIFDDASSQFLSNVNNFLPPEIQRFANNASYATDARKDFTEVLPSLNLKFELADDHILRFAVSKAIALPDMEDLRSHTSIGVNGIIYTQMPPLFNEDNPYTGDLYDTDDEGRPTTGQRDEDGNLIDPTNGVIDPRSVQFQGFAGSSGNPYLMPMKSIQYDLSHEWYFSSVGSLTTSLFYKDLSNFFIEGTYQREFTNPITGQTGTANISGPINGGDGKMYGVELAYQQFYDMLPEPWDGFGLQLNYSYIKASGVPSNNNAGNYIFGDKLPLEGQSEHTANAAVMYQKYGWEARLAYNWRSEYLLTTQDVITELPIWTDDLGFLDGSVFYNVTDDFKVGLQATNLLDTETRTFMQVDENLRLGRSWFINDRRFSLVARFNF